MINIYKLIHPETLEIKYIGKTNESLKRRLNKHINNKMNNAKVNKWIRSLGNLRPIIELIEEVSEDNWIEREKHWIKYYLEQKADLMNITIGGDCGALGYKHTTEAKQKIRIANSKPKSQEWIENAASAMTTVVSKPILQLDFDGNIINEWNSFCFAAKEINPQNYKAAIKNIHACCNKKRKSAYGYKWVYQQESIESKDKEPLR